MVLINKVRIGSTGAGKTLATARDIVFSPDEAAIVFDPTTIGSLARTILPHINGNVLYDNLSVRMAPGYTMIKPSVNPDADERAEENERIAEYLVPILCRRQEKESLAGTPLKEEWVMSAILLFLFQKVPQPLSILPFAYMPGTAEFQLLVEGCTLPRIKRQFRFLEKMSMRGLRAEVGSAARLVNSVFLSRSFKLRSRGGFDLGKFLQNKGKLIIERGVGVGEDTMRMIMGSISLLVKDHVARRPEPYPIIRIHMDESNTAGIFGGPEIRGIAETRKYSLFWDLLTQNLDFPCSPDDVFQNCKRHEWFGCSSYKLAREAATDFLAGLDPNGQSRAERLEEYTHEIMRMGPGWRLVRDPDGSRKEYVPLLENPWPDWPGLREAKLKEKLQWIYRREEYRKSDSSISSISSNNETQPQAKSDDCSFAAEFLKRRAKRRRDSSAENDDENGCESEAS